MIFPSLTTILVCFLEMFPLGRQMSFSSTRPMVISSESKSSRWVAPPFSVRMTLKGISAVSSGTQPSCTCPANQKRSLVEDRERYRILGVIVELAGILDQLLDPLAPRRHHPRRDVDGQLGLPVDEVP